MGEPVAGSAGRGPDRAGAVLELAFGRWSLYLLRQAVHEHAAAAGMPAGRVQDVVLAVHELASNVVRHGAGRGQARVWCRGGALCCQIEDGGLAPRGSRATGAEGWPCEPGHGLWVVRQLADEMSVVTGPGGTYVTVVFALR